MTGPLGIAQLGDVREIVSFFDLRFVPNVGVSLGLLPADSDAMRWGLVAMTAAIALGVVVWMCARAEPRRTCSRSGWCWAARSATSSTACGSAMSSTIADLHFGDWRPFLVFNVADAAITIGVLILLVRALLVQDKPRAEAPAGYGEIECVS